MSLLENHIRLTDGRRFSQQSIPYDAIKLPLKFNYTLIFALGYSHKLIYLPIKNKNKTKQSTRRKARSSDFTKALGSQHSSGYFWMIWPLALMRSNISKSTNAQIRVAHFSRS